MDNLASETLPLFPLNTLLLPHCRLRLQLFEPRYLDMLRRCLKAGQGFGIVRIIKGHEVGTAVSSFESVGCEAVVCDWHQQANGLLGICVEGRRRFRVVDTHVLPDQLQQAQVVWLTESSPLPITEPFWDLQKLLHAIEQHPDLVALGMPSVERLSHLADRLAYWLPFAPEEKQRLLEMNEAVERLTRIRQLFRQLGGVL